jgi:hypothetical protein
MYKSDGKTCLCGLTFEDWEGYCNGELLAASISRDHFFLKLLIFPRENFLIYSLESINFIEDL